MGLLFSSKKNTTTLDNNVVLTTNVNPNFQIQNDIDTAGLGSALLSIEKIQAGNALAITEALTQSIGGGLATAGKVLLLTGASLGFAYWTYKR